MVRENVSPSSKRQPLHHPLEQVAEVSSRHETLQDSPLALKDIFGESFEEKCYRIREASPFGQLSTWKLIQVIVKQGCDLRQEQFATQLISQFDQIFKQYRIPIWLRPYEIICTGPNSGLIQCVTDSISLDSLNQKLKKMGIHSLNEFFTMYFKTKEGMICGWWRLAESKQKTIELKKARYNFAESVAGYSLVCYILQIKDRHNGNILLDRNGHLIHIDFDYFISNSPGNNFHFEQAPFKLTKEYIEVMEGVKSACFANFKRLMVKGLIALQKEYKKIVVLIAMMFSVNQNLPCFVDKEKIISGLHCRLFPQYNGKGRGWDPMTEKEAEGFIEQYFVFFFFLKYIARLISEASGSFRTKVYDWYQYYRQGIN